MVSRGELTFQDIHGAEALLNEEDEDGYSCDWEPVQQKMPVEFVKWCCFSCTMANPGDMVHCYVDFAYFFMSTLQSMLISQASFSIATSLPTHTNKYSAPAARIAARLLNALQTTEFLFTSKVEAIETTNGWCYISCSKYSRKLQRGFSLFTCNFCND
ncbi:hypothetical protein DY000_02042130 [Brassica cretica]|uniref:Uncharacterized protein n=1 Tax=Brassica cretica TaxID=69181 RepID=A0ABQ7BDN0_BRACR|nr:hypothetical protein DY000_02042130 [Brassica cretica]